MRNKIAMIPAKLGTREEIYRVSLAASRLFSRSVDRPLEETFSHLLDLLVSELKARVALIGRLDKETLSLRILASAGPGADYGTGLDLSASPDVPGGLGPTGEVLRSGRPMVTNLPEALNRPDLAQFRDRAMKFGLGGSALVPIQTNSGLWGIVSVYRGVEDLFSPEILPLLESFSDDLASFLNRREESRELLVRRSFQRAIEELQTGFLASPEEGEIYQALTKSLVEKIGLPAAWIVKLGSSGPAFPGSPSPSSGFLARSVEAKDPRLKTVIESFSFPLDFEYPERTPLVSGAGASSPVFLPDIERDPFFRRFFPALRSLSAISLSNRSDGHPECFLMVGFEKKRGPSPGISGLLGQMAVAARMALNQRRDRIKMERYASFYRAIGQTSQLMARHPDATGLYDGVCEILVESTKIALAFVSLIEDGSRVRVVSARGPARGFVEGAVFSIDPADDGRCLIHSRTLDSDSVCSIPFLEGWLCSEEVRDMARPYGMKHTLTISLRRDGQRIGILALISDEERFFDSTLENLMEDLSRDITFSLEAHDRQERLTRLSMTDFLTNIPNRIAFQEEVSKELIRAKSQETTFSISILDLDGFKGWNDTFGHSEGDRLLKTLAARLSSCLRPGDRIARLGGDEFGFIRSGATRLELKEFSREILGVVEKVDTEMNIVTGSLGWASYPEDGESFRDLLAHADEALYAAKGAGRNTFRFFGGEIALALHRRIETHRIFPSALANGSICFYLQPQVDYRAGSLEGLEMLARWQVGSKVLSPAAFMPEVEKDPKFIRGLGRYALLHAIGLRKRLVSSALPLRVSLNIGASHFLHTAFVDDIDEALGGDSGEGLAIEVTESVALEDMSRTTRVIDSLKQRGFDVSLDDFGTGYSSLHYAADLPVTEIKLDQYFVRRFRNHTNAFAVVSATLLLSSLSGSSLVAEGVEFQEDLDLWLRMGGSKVQGYLLAKPMSEHVFMGWSHEAKHTLSDHDIPPVYPLEDMTFLEYAFRQKDSYLADRWHVLSECPLESWFEKRGGVYRGLPSWETTRETHRQMHQKMDRPPLRRSGNMPRQENPDLPLPLIEGFYRSLQSLRKELDASLLSVRPQGKSLS
jgi:diguanylate cyclase (GGDEF)-like protein